MGTGSGSDARTIVLIPTYNEAENVERAVAGVLEVIPADVLVIDDGSPDGTGEIAERLAAANPAVDVMHRPRKGGLAAAYRAGFARALAQGYDVIVQMDADGSHDHRALPAMVAALDDADLAIGSRYVPGGETPGWPRMRRLVSRGGSWYSRTLLGLPMHDTTSGFKAWRASLLRRIEYETVDARGYVFQIELALRAVRAGGRVCEVPITFVDRTAGESKFSAGILAEALVRVTMLNVRGQRYRRAA